MVLDVYPVGLSKYQHFPQFWGWPTTPSMLDASLQESRSKHQGLAYHQHHHDPTTHPYIFPTLSLFVGYICLYPHWKGEKPLLNQFRIPFLICASSYNTPRWYQHISKFPLPPQLQYDHQVNNRQSDVYTTGGVSTKKAFFSYADFLSL